MQSDLSFHYVDGRWLLALYAVIPLSFAVITFDALVLQRALLHNLLPDDPMIPRYTRAWGGRSAQPGVWRRHGALDYLEEAGKPLFLTINCSEDPDALHQMTVLRKRLAELGNDEVFLMDREPRGHKVTLDPEILRAMDQYLKSCLE